MDYVILLNLNGQAFYVLNKYAQGPLCLQTHMGFIQAYGLIPYFVKFPFIFSLFRKSIAIEFCMDLRPAMHSFSDVISIT